MVRINRKSAPKVRDGVVQLKNRWEPSPTSMTHPGDLPEVVRERPGRGYRHLLTQKQLRTFVASLPDWNELGLGLKVLLLAKHDDALGWHLPGTVALCAWERAFVWPNCTASFVEGHQTVLDKLHVSSRRNGKDIYLDFSQHTARAFQLVHVLIHELGHHHDRMTTRFQGSAARGEGFAEAYASKHEDLVLRLFQEQFGAL